MSPHAIRSMRNVCQDLCPAALSLLLLLPALGNSATAEILFQPARLDVLTGW